MKKVMQLNSEMLLLACLMLAGCKYQKPTPMLSDVAPVKIAEKTTQGYILVVPPGECLDFFYTRLPDPQHISWRIDLGVPALVFRSHPNRSTAYFLSVFAYDRQLKREVFIRLPLTESHDDLLLLDNREIRIAYCKDNGCKMARRPNDQGGAGACYWDFEKGIRCTRTVVRYNGPAQNPSGNFHKHSNNP